MLLIKKVFTNDYKTFFFAVVFFPSHQGHCEKKFQQSRPITKRFNEKAVTESGDFVAVNPSCLRVTFIPNPSWSEDLIIVCSPELKVSIHYIFSRFKIFLILKILIINNVNSICPSMFIIKSV